MPMNNAIGAVVTSMGPQNVDTVLIAGKVMKRNGPAGGRRLGPAHPARQRGAGAQLQECRRAEQAHLSTVDLQGRQSAAGAPAVARPTAVAWGVWLARSRAAQSHAGRLDYRGSGG